MEKHGGPDSCGELFQVIPNTSYCWELKFHLNISLSALIFHSSPLADLVHIEDQAAYLKY